MALLNAESLNFSYRGQETPHPVLRDLNLTVNEGEFLSILGPSGCGKSTLLRLLSGFLTPDAGRITLQSRPVTAPTPAGQMIFQDPAQLLPWLTVEGNIRLAAAPDALLDDLLTTTGLTAHRRYYPHQLSGGLKQRTALARALSANPALLFMDEPFVSLDAPARRDLQQLLLRLWQEQPLTVLFVSHDIAETLLLSDRILIFPGSGGAPFIESNPLERPRVPGSPEFAEQQLRLYSLVDNL